MTTATQTASRSQATSVREFRPDELDELPDQRIGVE